jgi:3-oxoacyl-[acyl-carrier-protein] synthase-3
LQRNKRYIIARKFFKAQMNKGVFITKLSKFLPNKGIPNELMEKYLGMVNNKPSNARRIVLKNNGIKNRYYALDENGNTTHSNAELTSLAIKNLTDKSFKIEDIELLACGTTSPDQILPSHAVMVHGALKGKNLELASFSGACCSGIQALKFGYLSVLSGNTNNAVCAGSERISRWLMAKNFEKETENLERLHENPYVSFEKEFIRWMLSDGAGAALLQNTPSGDISLKIEWLDITSYANELETCMYAAAEKQKDSSLLGWSEFESQEWLNKSIFSLKQDVKLLGDHIVKYGCLYLQDILNKRHLNINDITYFLPHLSSDLFRMKIFNALTEANIPIPEEKWFTNLTHVGNVGAASAYLMLEELFYSGKLKKGDKILLMVPESARFSYAYSLLTVV